MHLTPCRDHCHCSDIHAFIYKCREVFPVCGRMKPFHEMHLFTKSFLVQCCDADASVSFADSAGLQAHAEKLIRPRKLNTQSRKICERFRTFFTRDYCGFGEFGIGPAAMREWSKPSCEATKAKPNLLLTLQTLRRSHATGKSVDSRLS